MKKYIVIGIFLMLLITAIPTMAYTEENPFVRDLIAGQNEDVGDIIIWVDSGTLYVKYEMQENWSMGLTHVHIGNTLEDFPLNKKGHPKIGLFDYQMEHDPPVTEYIYEIPYSGEAFVAAHAEVCSINDPSVLDLPEMATLNAVHSWNTYFNSYFISTITNGEILNGIHDGWCVDRSVNMPTGQNCIVEVYSSYEPLPCDAVLYDENLDLVNWILNQDYVGKYSVVCDDVYTFGDVQMAIWDLITDNSAEPGSVIGPWSPCKREEIKTNALNNGEGYIPGCGDVVAVILYAASGTTPRAQNSLITIPMPCPECETAWGDGLPFVEKTKGNFEKGSWGMYMVLYPIASNENKSLTEQPVKILFSKIANLLEQIQMYIQNRIL